MRLAAHPGRHRGPAALAARRLAVVLTWRDHVAHPGAGRGDRRGADPVRPVGLRRRGGPAGRLGAGQGAGAARTRVGAGPGAVRRRESDPADLLDPVGAGAVGGRGIRPRRGLARSRRRRRPGSPAPLRCCWTTTGDDVGVTERGVLSGRPHWFRVDRGKRVRVVGWGGPWPVDERWWDDRTGPEGRPESIDARGALGYRAAALDRRGRSPGSSSRCSMRRRCCSLSPGMAGRSRVSTTELLGSRRTAAAQAPLLGSHRE